MKTMAAFLLTLALVSPVQAQTFFSNRPMHVLDSVDAFTGAVPQVRAVQLVQVSAHATCTTVTVECGSQIVVATYNEFPVLANDGMNGDAMEELLRRMIWHLNLNGVQAARQKNPSGRISTDKLAALIDGAWRAYDVLSDRDTPGPFRVGFDEVPGANPQPNDPRGPIADEGGAPPPPPPGGGNSPGETQQHIDDTRALLDQAVKLLEAQRVRDELILADIQAMRSSLEEHRAEVRKGRSQVLSFLGNWRNYLKIGLPILGTLIATGDVPLPGGAQ